MIKIKDQNLVGIVLQVDSFQTIVRDLVNQHDIILPLIQSLDLPGLMYLKLIQKKDGRRFLFRIWLRFFSNKSDA